MSKDKQVVKPNPIRHALVEKIKIAMAAHYQREDVGDMRHLYQAIDFNQEFVDRSRGKGKAKGMIKSIASKNHWLGTTYFPPEKRNGQRECERRLRQAY